MLLPFSQFAVHKCSLSNSGILPGESNHYIGNKKYRKYIGERKDDYRKIAVKQRKQKTDFVRAIVQHIKNCGGRFIDVTFDGKHYVVTDEKARKKT